MVHSKKARELAEELAGVLTHNKYLLDSPEELTVVLECRFITILGDSFQEGKESIITNDLTSLGIPPKSGVLN